MSDPVLVSTDPTPYQVRVDAGMIVATAVSGSTVRTTPETLIKWIDQVARYLEAPNG